MIKKVFLIFIGLMMTISMTSCHFVSPDADEEAVLIYKPWIFGHGGVNDEPITTGLTWCWATTHSEIFKITPQRYDIEFDDSSLSSDKLSIMTKTIDMPTLLNSDDLDDFFSGLTTEDYKKIRSCDYKDLVLKNIFERGIRLK